MKLNISAGQSCTTSGEGYGPLNPLGRMRNRLYAKTWIGREAAMELAPSFSEVEMCVPRSGDVGKRGCGWIFIDVTTQ